MQLKKIDRCNQIIDEYQKGFTLEEIATDLRLTRERVRQLINTGLEYSIIEEKEVPEYERSLKTLKFSDRAMNGLIKHNIFTFLDLETFLPSQIMNLSGIGKKTGKEIIYKAEKAGIKLNGQESLFIRERKGTPLEIFKFSDRALNSLNKNNIYYFEQLLEYSKEELDKLQSLGKIVLKDILKVVCSAGYELSSVSLSEKVEIRLKKLKENHKSNRIKLRIGEGNIEEKRSFLLDKVKGYSSKVLFLRDIDTTLTTLKELFPNVLEILERNQLNRQNQWSRHYIRCLCCRTTLVPHQAYGLCKNCYVKSDYYKEIQKNSHQKYKEKRKDKVRAYLKEYSKRPEIIERNRKKNDIKKYGGNREKCILKYKSICVNCQNSRLESTEKWGKDLCVIHIDGNSKNNIMENLKPLCYGCFMKHPKGGR